MTVLLPLATENFESRVLRSHRPCGYVEDPRDGDPQLKPTHLASLFEVCLLLSHSVLEGSFSG